ncbi:MAG TPA: FtsQ-type POTRA domain-containing protein [bacterium]|nr:FtsQ-type POTRA domain-containing protein [bacterium]
MYYRGSRVSLSESQPRFYKKPEPRTWRERAREKPREKMFRLSLRLVREAKERKPEREERVVHGFYRPNRLTTAPVRETARTGGAAEEKPFRLPAGMGRAAGVLLKAGLVVGLVGALAWSKVRTSDLLQQMSGLTLARISVVGTHFLTEDQVAQAVRAPLGENMFKLDLAAVSAQVGSLSWVKRVFVERRLPKTLLISVVERRPAALLDEGSLYAVDGEGRILAPSPALSGVDLPVVSGLSFPPEAVGTTEEAGSLKPALDFLAFLRKQDGSLAQDVSEVNLSQPGCLQVTFLDGVTARFNPGVTDEELRHMALVLGDLNEKGKKAASLDFRYKGEVLVRARQ